MCASLGEAAQPSQLVARGDKDSYISQTLSKMRKKKTHKMELLQLTVS